MPETDHTKLIHAAIRSRHLSQSGGTQLQTVHALPSIKAEPLKINLPCDVISDVEAARVSTEVEEQRRVLRDERERKLSAVKKHGGKAAGQRQTCRERVRWQIEGVTWQACLLITAFVDLMLLFIELYVRGSMLTVKVVTSVILVVFVFDLLARFYAYRLKLLTYVTFWFDFLIVGASVLLHVVALLSGSATAEVGATSVGLARGGKALRGLIVALRWVRVSRFAAKILRTGATGSTTARHVTGENKKRFLDLEAGFDLDLAYVLPDLIAMSVPATGLTSLYRNPLNEVVRFFESRHRRQGYVIVNCCPELPYPAVPFASGEVVPFDIQDHTPPTMEQFVDFLNAFKDKPPGKVLAVHCRGGKGRTGSMACAWLLYSRACMDADDALTHFALERTELALGKKKVQGVDTPSQRRYVHQLDALLKAQEAYLPNGAAADKRVVGEDAAPVASTGQLVGGVQLGGDGAAPGLVRPPARPKLTLVALELAHWYAKPPKGPLVCAVHPEDGLEGSGKVMHWSKPVGDIEVGTTVRFELGGFEVAGDVRVSVFELDELVAARQKRVDKGCAARLPFDGAADGPWGFAPRYSAKWGDKAGKKDSKRVVAGKEAGCKFFLLFHTGFVSDDGALPVPLAMMDKAFKNKNSKYHEDAVATLRFSLV